MRSKIKLLMMCRAGVDGAAIKRVIAPSEQADAILFLCSDSAAMITGHMLPVDGGWTARC